MRLADGINNTAGDVEQCTSMWLQHNNTACGGSIGTPLALQLFLSKYPNVHFYSHLDSTVLHR